MVPFQTFLSAYYVASNVDDNDKNGSLHILQFSKKKV